MVGIIELLAKLVLVCVNSLIVSGSICAGIGNKFQIVWQDTPQRKQKEIIASKIHTQKKWKCV